jgi:hypothetical protein
VHQEASEEGVHLRSPGVEDVCDSIPTARPYFSQQCGSHATTGNIGPAKVAAFNHQPQPAYDLAPPSGAFSFHGYGSAAPVKKAATTSAMIAGGERGLAGKRDRALPLGFPRPAV